MLKHKRPSGSKAMRRFGRKFLAPVFGNPDADGNYTLQIGQSPNVMFTAHYDTVHRKGGTQALQIERNIVSLPPESRSDCLGADCTTGIWLILIMIAARVPGYYAIFADEEIGCKGSQAFVTERASELLNIDFVISFDRAGSGSIITHQSGFRTASDTFAQSLESILGMGMKADPTGSFTDSNEFAHIVPECTNISVGYFNQHSARESQCLDHAETLAQRLIVADWSRLVVARDPSTIEWDSPFTTMPDQDRERLLRAVIDYPEAVAALLIEKGLCEWDIYETMQRDEERDQRRAYEDFDPDTGLTMTELLARF